MDDLNRRRAAWAALSELFLDTEINVDALARALRETQYGVAELDAMLRREVAPVLGANVLSVAGEWVALDLAPVEHRYRAGRRARTLTGWLACRLVRDEWAQVVAALRRAAS